MPWQEFAPAITKIPMMVGANSNHGTTDSNHGTTDSNHGTTDSNHGTTDSNHGTTDSNHGNLPMLEFSPSSPERSHADIGICSCIPGNHDPEGIKYDWPWV